MAKRMTGFTARVLATVRRIPVGRVATYGDVAAVAGRPEGDRLLVILGDIPADSLKAMLLRVR